jgi:glycosyltransferase involved in cell wall biosynthesis
MLAFATGHLLPHSGARSLEVQNLAFDSTDSTKLAPEPTQTVIVPAYNESFRIKRSLKTILNFLAEQSYRSDVILVDDGSSDDTADEARKLEETNPNLTVHSIPHGGKAAAVLYGLDSAEGDLILFTDADLATPITYLNAFRTAVSDGADVVIGSREGETASRIGEPAFRHLMGRGFNAMVRILLLPGIHDTQCGFKLFTANARDQILPRLLLYRGVNGAFEEPKVTAFDVELLVVAQRLGMNIDVIPVTWTFGERSKVNPVGDTITNFSDVAHVKWNDVRGRYE